MVKLTDQEEENLSTQKPTETQQEIQPWRLKIRIKNMFLRNVIIFCFLFNLLKPETNGVSNGEQNGNHHVEQNGTSQENEKNELNHSDQENQKPKPHRAGNKKTRVSKK